MVGSGVVRWKCPLRRAEITFIEPRGTFCSRLTAASLPSRMALVVGSLTIMAFAWLPLHHLVPPRAPPTTRGVVLTPPLMCSDSSLLKELAPSRNRERRWTANEMGLVDEATATITRTQAALREKTAEASEATMARDKAAAMLLVAEAAARDAEASARAVGESATAAVQSAQAEAGAAREALSSATARFDAADEAVAAAQAAAQAVEVERDEATARAEAAESVSARFADALEKKAAEVRVRCAAPSLSP